VKPPKLLVIVGETASGKTELALELAKRLDGEIICADSWTVRKGVDIGTAKPTAEERAAVPHHLLDVVEPCGEFTAAVFKQLANEAIDDIAARGKLPIMVGGTGLYMDGVLYDYGFLPAGDRKAREELNRLSIAKLRERVERSKLDTSGIDTRNKRRLIRLLETRGRRAASKPLRENTFIMGLKLPRELIEQRIIDRLDAMLMVGLEDEVRGLVERNGWDCEALKESAMPSGVAILRARKACLKPVIKLSKQPLNIRSVSELGLDATKVFNGFPPLLIWQKL